MRSRRGAFARLLAVALGVMVCLSVVPGLALAANDSTDISLGVFFTSDNDVTDTVYASYDGRTFYAIDTAYQDANTGSAADNRYSGNHWTHKNPGIVYHNGYFWMVSNEQGGNGVMTLAISYSKDLQHWTHPDTGAMFTADSTKGVTVDQAPTVNGQPYQNFDVVAAKLAETSDGLYLTFAAGYYGDYHGQHAQDQMQVYTCKITQLSAQDGTSAGDGYLWPNNLVFKAETAKRVTLDGGTNYIDSNFYSEGGSTYLLAKKDGLIEQIYRSNTPNDPNSWQLVNGRASYGYEGVSINKANGTYYLYGDGVLPTKPLGIRMVTSSSITRGDEWSDSSSTSSERLSAPTFYAADGTTQMSARHGDVITLTAGTSEWRIAKALLDQNPEAVHRSFSDVSRGDWFFEAVRYVTDRGIMNGYSGGTSFGPNDSLPREQAATVMYNYLGNGATAARCTLSDVLAGQWYTQSVDWAVANGVMNGYSGGTRFGVGDTLTREQIAAVIANAAHADVASESTSRLDAMPDASSVDGWARQSVAWALNHGVISGVERNRQRYVSPKTAVTRAQMAAIMMNAIEHDLL